MVRGRALVMAGVLAAVAAVCAAQQLGSGQDTGMQSGSPQLGDTTGNHKSKLGSDPFGDQSPFPDNSKQKRNEDRQKRLVADTQKLLALTSQLKAEVASSGAETMSPEMLKQTEEIEKLAKSVKDKMRD